MGKDEGGSRRGDASRRRWWGVAGVAAAAVLLLGAWVAPVAWSSVQTALYGPDATEPSCSWTVDIHGADADQAALIRCYLRAVARHSDSGMRAVVNSKGNGGPTGFSAADFAHAHDAADGTASVSVTGNAVDSAEATVTIRYADGAHDQLEIYLANPASWHSWRFVDIGTLPPDPIAPPPAIG